MRFAWARRLAICLLPLAPSAWLLGCAFLLWAPWMARVGSGLCLRDDSFVDSTEPPLLTPAQITPPLPLLPVIAMLRAVTFDFGGLSSKLLGVIVAVTAFLAPLVLVFFHWAKTPARAWLCLLGVPWILLALGVIALFPPFGAPLIAAQMLTIGYFGVWFVAFPLLARQR